MLNGLWIAMIVGAIVCGALTGTLEEVSKASTASAKEAVEIAINLVGVMALWLGLMRVLQRAGALRAIARGLRPVMRWLFPGVPDDHPAISMIILNMTANMLGLGNAATPFGLKAMVELNKLNEHKGTATNAMALFLAINTSHLALVPTGMIATRAALGSEATGAIWPTTLLATSCSTLVAILVAKLVQGLRVFAPTPADGPMEPEAEVEVEKLDTSEAEEAMAREVEAPGGWYRALFVAVVLVVVSSLGYAFWAQAETLGWSGAAKLASSKWVLAILMVAFVLYGFYKRAKVYDAVVEGGKEGFDLAVRIIPYLVAILVGVGMLRASGALGGLVRLLDPLTSLVGMPGEALPMALLRPLSAQGAYGVATDIMKVNGPDSLVGFIVSTMQGSTETTFYVLALYCGVVCVRNTRHTLVACLAADVTGALAAVWACRLLLG